MKVLITAPSLEETENVSGISSVVTQIIKSAGPEFVHFAAGRKDGESLGIRWILAQILLIPRFLLKTKNTRPAIIHINTALTPLSIFRDSALIITSRSLNYPVILHIHGGKFFTQGFRNGIFSVLTRIMLKSAKVVLVLSESDRKFVENLHEKCTVRVLKNAVPFYESQKNDGRPTREKSLLFLGRLHKGKGLDEIVEACRILKSEGFEFRFKCFGTGEMKDSFVAKMNEILGDRFFYGGVVSGAEKRLAFAESDIFLLPSHYEGMPISLLEAMAAGCVPVVSDVGSIGDAVENEVNGFLIEPRDHGQITNTLKRLLSDEIDWVKMRENAKSTIREHYEIKDYLSKLQEIYGEFSK